LSRALQKLADSLTADEMIACAQKWLIRFTPFFTSEERFGMFGSVTNETTGYV
jgi:hypothetical protein